MSAPITVRPPRRYVSTPARALFAAAVSILFPAGAYVGTMFLAVTLTGNLWLLLFPTKLILIAAPMYVLAFVAWAGLHAYDRASSRAAMLVGCLTPVYPLMANGLPDSVLAIVLSLIVMAVGAFTGRLTWQLAYPRSTDPRQP